MQNMEKFPMCRICLAIGVKMQQVANTHLQEMYQSLTFMPLETEDSRPTQACDICWAKLEDCYQLRQCCLQSEKVFAEMLRNNVFVPMESLPKVTTEEQQEYTACVVKTEPPEQDSCVEFVPMESLPKVATEEQQEYTACVVKTEPPEQDSCVVVKIEVEIEKDAPIPEEPTSLTQLYAEASTSSHQADNEHTDTTVAELKANNKTTVNDISLNQSNIQTPTGDKPYQCNECGKCFVNKIDLDVHSRKHTREKPYQCHICNKCFTLKRCLGVHIGMHTGEKRHECNVCKKSFSGKTALFIHRRTHTGEKPFQCNECEKSFVKKFDLDRHNRVHTGEKPYQCNVCKKCFKGMPGLNAHRHMHTGEKPYQCNECNIAFSKKSALNIHIRNHTGEKPYQCNKCKMCFGRKYDLYAHNRTHTNDKSEAV